MRREGRIPHRRFCREKVQGFDGVTGQPEEVSKLNYFVLEREGNNHSKCRRPSLLITSSADPKWKSRGKAKGQGRARRKDCLHNPLLQDLELVDPDKPSSWQAQQIAAQLSDEELEDESATDCEAQEDSDCATGGPARAVAQQSRSSLLASLRSITESGSWPADLRAHASDTVPVEQSAALRASTASLPHSEPAAIAPPESSVAGFLARSVSAEPPALIECVVVPSSAASEAGESDSDWEMLSDTDSWDIISEGSAGIV